MTDKLQVAYGRFQARDLAGAARLCGEVLSETPGNRDALHLLGVVRLAGGEAGEAASLIKRALDGGAPDAAILENLGVAHLALKDYVIAERMFRDALALGAAHASIYMRLGIALSSQGKLEDALTVLREAAVRAPDVPDVHLNLGNALAERGEAEAALACYNRVLALQPDHPLALFNIGNLHRYAGRLGEAEMSFKQVLAVAPDDVKSHNNLGIVYEQQGRLEEAAACFKQALALGKDRIQARNNLGNVFRAQGRLEDAIGCYEQVIAESPSHVDAHVNLGIARSEQGRHADAEALYRKALLLDAHNFEAHFNLGTLLKMQGRLPEAVAQYRQAIDTDPTRDIARLGLADAHRRTGDLDSAIACYRKAIELKPEDAAIHGELAETLKLHGELEGALRAYGRALGLNADHLSSLGGMTHVRQHVCDWKGIEELWQRLRVAIAGGGGASISPFAVLSMPTSPAEQLACAEAWARRNLDPIAALRPGLGFDFSKRRARDRLRIGYLAWGLHGHATGHWAAELFELHDRARYEVFAYSYGPDDASEVRARIRAACEHFIPMAEDSHPAAARRIYDDGVDVLVDLTGYSLGMRPQIAALRPAPVQVSWFHAGTMGTRCMDYFIADPYVVPPELEPYFTERIVRLPDCYMITDRKRPIADPGPSRGDCGLPDTATVFCCFNHSYKILPDVFASWMRVMRATPDSVLWLLETNRWAAENLRRSATEHGVAAERIVFAPIRPQAEHLARYRLVDLALDTFPYTSHTTAADALWVGCPLVTRAGSTFASRVAGSVLNSAGMRELITEGPEACERLAVELAQAPGRLKEIRGRLRAARDTCALFDTPRFVRNLEAAYDRMFEDWLKEPGA